MIIPIALAIMVASASCQFEDEDAYADIFGNPDQQRLKKLPSVRNIGDKPCLTENNEEGICVVYYLCDSITNSVIVDGKSIIDMRWYSTECGEFESCCSLDDMGSGGKKRVSQRASKERTSCGWRNKDGVEGIKGKSDTEANFGEFPWMVAIIKYENVNYVYGTSNAIVFVGSGSLIHPSVVLTVAHHISKRERNLRVRAGEWDTSTVTETYPYQDRNVRQTKVHKDFNSGNLFYDIAILFLDQPMDLAPNVGLACLPSPNEVVDAGTRCFASGWGKDSFGRYQVILKKVEVPVVDRNTCQQKLRSTRLGRHFMLHSSFMCAGGEKGKDTCRGDGGSPLVCPMIGEDGRYVQRGLVAWGIGCGENGVPGVYVDVANLRNWIDNAVASQGYDTNDYSADVIY